MDDHRELLLRHRIKPEGALYVGQNDTLRFGVQSGVSGANAVFRGYMLMCTGEVVEFAVQVTDDGLGGLSTTSKVFGEGFILSCAATPSGAADVHGSAYVEVRIVRAEGSGTFSYSTLLAGYLSHSFSPSFPQTPPAPAMAGMGQLFAVSVAAPAAGAELSFTCATNMRHRIVSGYFTLTTAAVATTRRVNLRITSAGGTTILRLPAQDSQIISLTTHYNVGEFGAAHPTGINNTNIIIPGGLFLQTGSVVLTSTTNIDPGDQFSAALFFLERWFDAS